jgi:DNA-binding MarR family transcriptional regulator
MQAPDLLDDLVAEWKVERPDLDASSMLVVGRILRLGQLLEAGVSNELKAFNLHYTDFDILATLRRKGKPFRLTPTELSAAVLITSGAMTAALRRLENAKLVDRKPDEHDRRVRHVALTKQGKQLVEKAIVTRFQQSHDSVEPLTKGEQKELAVMLRKLLAGFEKTT